MLLLVPYGEKTRQTVSRLWARCGTLLKSGFCRWEFSILFVVSMSVLLSLLVRCLEHKFKTEHFQALLLTIPHHRRLNENMKMWGITVTVVRYLAPKDISSLLDFAAGQVSISWWRGLVANPWRIFISISSLAFFSSSPITWSLPVPCWYLGCCPSKTCSLVQRLGSGPACAPPWTEASPGLHQQAAAIWGVAFSGKGILPRFRCSDLRLILTLVLLSISVVRFLGMGGAYPAWLWLGCCSGSKSPPSGQSSSTEGEPVNLELEKGQREKIRMGLNFLESE